MTCLNYQKKTHVHEDSHILASVQLKPTLSKDIKAGWFTFVQTEIREWNFPDTPKPREQTNRKARNCKIIMKLIVYYKEKAQLQEDDRA